MTGDESSRMFCIRQPNKDGVTKKPPAAQTASESSKDKQSAHGREVMSRQRLFQTSVNLEKKKETDDKNKDAREDEAQPG